MKAASRLVRALPVLPVLLAAGLAGCGNANVVTANDITQNYVNAIAEGNFPGACALLETRTRDALQAAGRGHCAAILARCLPDNIRVSAADQSQLLYVDINLQTTGRRAVGTVTGLPVARAIRRVTLLHADGRWRLTTAGRAVERCVRRRHSARRGDRTHSGHG